MHARTGQHISALAFSSKCRELFIRTLLDQVVRRYPLADYEAVRAHCATARRTCSLGDLEQQALESHNRSVGAWYAEALRNLDAHQPVQLEPSLPRVAPATVAALAASVVLEITAERFVVEAFEAVGSEPASDAGATHE